MQPYFKLTYCGLALIGLLTTSVQASATEQKLPLAQVWEFFQTPEQQKITLPCGEHQAVSCQFEKQAALYFDHHTSQWSMALFTIKQRQLVGQKISVTTFNSFLQARTHYRRSPDETYNIQADPLTFIRLNDEYKTLYFARPKKYDLLCIYYT